MTIITVEAVRAHEALVFVDGVRVRWRVDPTKDKPVPNWRCDEHGTSHGARCHHVAHAATGIAHQLLGIPAAVITNHEGHPMTDDLDICTCMGPSPGECPVHPSPPVTITPTLKASTP